MEMTMSIEELQTKLRNISLTMVPAIEKGMTDAVQNVEGRSKELCPVITGTLRRSISSETKTTGNEIKGIVGANTEYAEAVELGTSKRPPHAYLMPAIIEKESETLRILGDAVEDGIRRHTRAI